MRGLSNYHTHTTYCDGRAHVEEVVKRAVELKMVNIGISSHAPVPFETDWTMKPHRLFSYCRDVRDAQIAYHDAINVFLGLEVDYIPGALGSSSPHIARLGLDYTIGSVHFMGVLEDGTHWTVDGERKELADGIDASFGGDSRAAVVRYYEAVGELVEQHAPHIIGHIDLIKRFNTDESLFSEGDDWYRSAVLHAVERIARSDSCVEINTGGISRGYTAELYPSEWIARECFHRNIPMIVSADAHDPQHLTAHFAEAIELMKRVGYRKQRVLTGAGWRLAPLP